jgi:alcohol dehydrogenase class IV
VPTTAGTGAEVTKNAVLVSEKHHVKVSLRSPFILPSIAVVDPLLTHKMPASVTASTGLDAFTQVIEPFVSHLNNPLTDAFCREGITRVRTALRQVFDDGENAQAREDMTLASLCGGIALANAKLGAVHGFAGVLGGMYEAPHGVICGRLLPVVVEANVTALLNTDFEHKSLARYREITRILTDGQSDQALDCVNWIQDLVDYLSIPGLRKYGITTAKFPEIIDNAKRSSSMRGNPIKLPDEVLYDILEQSL